MIKEFPNIIVTSIIFLSCIIIAVTLLLENKQKGVSSPKFELATNAVAKLVVLGVDDNQYKLVYSQDGTTWENCTINDLPSPDNSLCGQVKYGNGLWVLAVGNNYIRFSRDGKTWNSNDKGTGDDGEIFPSVDEVTEGDFLAHEHTQGSVSLCYSTSQSKWVVGGRGKRLIHEDTVDIDDESINTDRTLDSIGSKYTKGQRGLYFSTDARSWKRTFITSDVSSDSKLLLNRPYEIEYDDVVFDSTPEDDSNNNYDAGVDDTITLSHYPQRLGSLEIIYSEGKNTWVSVGQSLSDSILSSSDGIIWRRATYVDNDITKYIKGEARSVTETPEGFIALGTFLLGTEKVVSTLVSEDGYTWEEYSIQLHTLITDAANDGANIKRLQTIKYFPKHKVCILTADSPGTYSLPGASGLSMIFHSKDIKNFTEVTNIKESVAGFRLTQPVYSNFLRKFYVLEKLGYEDNGDDKARLYTSDDGKTWSRTNITPIGVGKGICIAENTHI